MRRKFEFYIVILKSDFPAIKSARNYFFAVFNLGLIHFFEIMPHN